MPESAIEHLDKPYERVLIPQESGRYFAKITEFPGCFADGESPAKAFKNLEETAIAWIESELSKNRNIPPPEQDQQYSGKLMIRISPVLHEECAKNAERQGVSLNHYIAQKLSALTREDSVFYEFKTLLMQLRTLIALVRPSDLPMDVSPRTKWGFFKTKESVPMKGVC